MTSQGTVIARFEIRRRHYLNASGNAEGPLPDFAKDPSALIPLYRAMVLTRTFDAKAVALQRTGRLGTYAVSLGQEAVSAGAASAMRPANRNRRSVNRWCLTDFPVWSRARSACNSWAEA